MSPIETLLASSVVSLAGVIAWLYKEQKRSSAAAHAETRAETQSKIGAMQERIKLMDGHVKECNDDREALRVRVGILEDREARKLKCPRKDCPVRIP